MDAKTPKPAKTRVTNAPAKLDPFAEFTDWLKQDSTGRWKSYLNDEELSDEQKRIVAANAELLADRNRWHEKVAAFEAALATIADDEERTAIRGEYTIHFDRHDFGDGEKDFFEYSFPCSVSFVGAKFGNGSVSFDRATFANGDVLFEMTSFGTGTVSFHAANFGNGNLWIADAKFDYGFASFIEAKIDNGNVFFIDTEFSTLWAQNMNITGDLFVDAAFNKSANFNSLKVGGTADFSGSTFAEAPDFRDAKLDRPPEVARMVVPPPKLVRTGWQPFRIAKNEDDVARYRKLKAMALAANDHEKDGEFFAYEMLAKRGRETTTISGLLFNTLYHQLGNFGQSYLRPLAWMAASFCFFAAVYGLIIGKAGGWPANLLFALETSLRNAVPLFGALFKAIPAPKDHKSAFDRMFATLSDAGVNMDLIGWIGMAQSLFGGVLLFLLLLALRNKFRLK